MERRDHPAPGLCDKARGFWAAPPYPLMEGYGHGMMWVYNVGINRIQGTATIEM